MRMANVMSNQPFGSYRTLFPAALVALGLIASACSGETEPAAQPVEAQQPTTTTTTIPPETTTTIDFNRPITQDTIPIGEETSISDLAAVVASMRGQTINVSDQMSRLARFQELATPNMAQILDFSTAVSPIPDEDDFVVESTVLFRVPQDRLTIEMFLLDELRSRGWNKASETSQPVDGVTTTTLVFRIPGTPGNITELTAIVSELPGQTQIDLAYQTRVPEEDTSFERLQFWQDELATPFSADVTQVSAATADDLGVISVVYELDAETPAEASEDILELQDEEVFRIGTAPETETEAFLLIDQSRQEWLVEFATTDVADTIAMTVSNTFDLEPIDPAE